MASETDKLNQDPSQRVKINQKRCVVCGAQSSRCKGKLFYQTGRARFGAPFCKKHASLFDEYAHPVFENRTAQNLFKYMYPQTYQKKVTGKPVLYFDTFKHRNLKK